MISLVAALHLYSRYVAPYVEPILVESSVGRLASVNNMQLQSDLSQEFAVCVNNKTLTVDSAQLNQSLAAIHMAVIDAVDVTLQ